MNKELLNKLMDLVDGKDVKLDVYNFKSFTDFKLGNKLSNITGSGKGNVVKQDSSGYDKKKVKEIIDEIKRIPI